MVGNWWTTDPFTIGRDGHGGVAYNGFLYIIGGSSSGVLGDTQYAPLTTPVMHAKPSKPPLFGGPEVAPA